MKLAVILLTWNDADVTAACLRNVTSWLPEDGHVWVVDNGSKRPFHTEDATTTVIRNEQNLGFAGGVNSALRQDQVACSDAVLLLNTDAVLEPSDAAELLARFESHPEVSAMSPRLCETDGMRRLYYDGARNMGRHLSTRCRTSPDADGGAPVQPAAFLSGTAFLCRTTVFQKIGFFDERYFFSGEIADLCYHMSQAGLMCAVCTSAQVTHDLTPKQHQRASIHVYYALRNRFLFVRTHEPLWLRPVMVAFWTVAGAATVLKGLAAGNMTRSAAALRAIGDGLTGRYGNRHAVLRHQA